MIFSIMRWSLEVKYQTYILPIHTFDSISCDIFYLCTTKYISKCLQPETADIEHCTDSWHLQLTRGEQFGPRKKKCLNLSVSTNYEQPASVATFKYMHTHSSRPFPFSVHICSTKQEILSESHHRINSIEYDSIYS